MGFEQFLIVPTGEKGGGISFSGSVQLLGFCTFEACVGIFWPSIMKMRSQYIPEEARSTIMNFFRIPLNIFVCVVLYNVSFFLYVLSSLSLFGKMLLWNKYLRQSPMKVFFMDHIVSLSIYFNICFVSCFLKVDAFPIIVMFGMCSIFLFVASLLQRRLLVIAESQKPSKFWLPWTLFSACIRGHNLLS